MKKINEYNFEYMYAITVGVHCVGVAVMTNCCSVWTVWPDLNYSTMKKNRRCPNPKYAAYGKIKRNAGRACEQAKN